LSVFFSVCFFYVQRPPLGPEKFGAMQRVVWKRPVVIEIQVGHWTLRLAVVDWWSLFRGGCNDRFDCTMLWDQSNCQKTLCQKL
jgi:hypothetical protein